METELPRYEAPNPYNYNPIQMAKRKRDIKAMIIDYPSVNPMWCEWMYDIIENMPPDEVNDIIMKGLWEGPSKLHSKATSGVFNTVEVLDPEIKVEG